jgi:chloramphenicol 3-O-phosphotransferase
VADALNGKRDEMPKTGHLIVVTGTTGSGKTTTCQEFVNAADDLWFHLGIDLIASRMVSRKFVDGGPRSNEGIHMVPDDPSDPAGPRHLEIGACGAAIVHTLHKMAASAVSAGQNVIMDHVTTVHPPLLQDCVACLAGLPVLFVALRPPEARLQSRIDQRLAEVIASLGPEHGTLANENTKRASKYIAREIFGYHDFFDLTIDTVALSPREVVDAISARLKKGPGEAFKSLAQKFGTASPLASV